MLIQPLDPSQTPHPYPPAPQPRTPPTQPSMVYVYEQTRWEYKVLLKDADEQPASEADLNALGADGWELAGVGSIAGRTQFYFKRPRR